MWDGFQFLLDSTGLLVSTGLPHGVREHCQVEGRHADTHPLCSCKPGNGFSVGGILLKERMVDLLLTGLENTLQKRWSSFNLLKMPCLKRNPALASPSGIETGICTSDVISSLSIASHLCRGIDYEDG